MTGFIFDPAAGQIRIEAGTRTVATSEGLLIGLLPQLSGIDTSINVAFPDFSKAWLYDWRWISNYNFLNEKYGWVSSGQTSLTVLPQEFEQTQIIAAVPSGADYFKGHIRINRPSAPSHAWGGQPLNVLPPGDVWIPLTGSVLLEAEVNMSRLLSIYISNGNLVAQRKQTVGPAPGGYGQFGSTPFPFQATGSGGNWFPLGGAGLPVLGGSFVSSSGTSGGTFPPTTQLNQHKWNGSSPASTSDPTNYGSTYFIEIIGQFGRRS